MNGYKTIDELSADQFAELRNAAECDLLDKDTPDEWWNEDGSLKDSAVKAQYAGTVFTDDDFVCTMS